MAMTLRLPEELDKKIEEIAERRHISKHALIAQSVEQFVREDEERRQVDEAFDYAFERYGKVIERLADA
ncbi:CopG family ribbon-helix-helix protein [Nesterenkonia sedimenti]|nr:ribbon-helix-helix protein, CopG family [Nesterenkonia sedimenti]